MATIPMSEIRKHNTMASAWMVLFNKVYDITDFLNEHPGGAQILLDCSGKDGTKAFSSIHGPSIVSLLPKKSFLGEVDPTTITGDDIATLKTSQAQSFTLPPLEHILNIYDFEYTASQVMTKEGWDYYSSGGDDEITLRENHAAFQRIWLKPRVLIDVSKVDTSGSILGNWTSFPLYVSATALGKLAHPDGELAITRGAYSEGIIQMIPTLASCSLDEMLQARQADQVQFYQLYVNPDRKITEQIVKKAEAGGCRALCVTVDAPQLGRREKDMRNKFSAKPPDVQKGGKIERSQGTARAISKFIDPSLCWADIAWLKSITKMPIVLKGIQCGEDAVLAAQHGVQAIILSNHGGRQLDFSRSAIEILPEVITALRKNHIPIRTYRNPTQQGMEVWIDGGIRRGTDIFKAIALGATAVGVGRPILYGLAGYGQPGVEKAIQILKEELEMTMALMGTTSLKEIKEEMLSVHSLRNHSNGIPEDYLRLDTYQRLRPVSFNSKL